MTADLHRDFDAPEPTAYDASAGTIAANGLRMLSALLLASDPEAAEYYLERSITLVQDILRECLAPPVSLKQATASGSGHQQRSEQGEQKTEVEVDWGQGGWESILMHSTSTGNPKREVLMDHGMICECNVLDRPGCVGCGE